MRIALVVAMTPNRLIGKDGRLPWKLPADMRHFRRTTMGHPVVMGRRTWESIGAPLKGRTNIVLTSRREFEAPGCQVVHSIDMAVRRAEAACRKAGTADRDCWLMVIGGSAVYAAFLPLASRVYLTLVDADLSGDTYFPHYDSSAWREIERHDHDADARNPYAYSFRILEPLEPPH